MSKAVVSDGTVQAAFNKFLERFESMDDDEIKKAVAWFSAAKENGRERMDDVNLPSLERAAVKFYDKYGDKATNNPPAIIKKYQMIKLAQGKATWGKEAATSAPGEKMPWD